MNKRITKITNFEEYKEWNWFYMALQATRHPKDRTILKPIMKSIRRKDFVGKKWIDSYPIDMAKWKREDSLTWKIKMLWIKYHNPYRAFSIWRLRRKLGFI